MILNEVNLQQISQESDIELIKKLFAAAFWNWYDSNETRKLTTIKLWFIRKTVIVSDLRGVFEIFFGPHP